MMIQLISPNLEVKAYTGWCLWHAQSTFFGSDPKYHPHRSAWEQWEATQFKHRDRNFPDAAVPVWFEHWGAYGVPPTYDNWGHVVVWVPGKGFLSAPRSGYGSEWLPSIAEVERVFNCKLKGWSEDISGIKVVDEGEDMGRIQELEKLANDRQAALVELGKEVSVNYKNFNDLPQIKANIRFMAERVTQLTDIVSIKGDVDEGEAQKRLQAIREALGIK